MKVMGIRTDIMERSIVIGFALVLFVIGLFSVRPVFAAACAAPNKCIAADGSGLSCGDIAYEATPTGDACPSKLVCCKPSSAPAALPLCPSSDLPTLGTSCLAGYEADTGCDCPLMFGKPTVCCKKKVTTGGPITTLEACTTGGGTCYPKACSDYVGLKKLGTCVDTPDSGTLYAAPGECCASTEPKKAEITSKEDCAKASTFGYPVDGICTDTCIQDGVSRDLQIGVCGYGSKLFCCIKGGAAEAAAAPKFVAGSSMEIKSPLGSADLPTVLGNIIKSFLGLVGAFGLLTFVYAGILYLTSAGREDAVKKSKDTMKYAFLGLVIIFFAYAITNYFFAALTS